MGSSHLDPFYRAIGRFNRMLRASPRLTSCKRLAQTEADQIHVSCPARLRTSGFSHKQQLEAEMTLVETENPFSGYEGGL